MTGLDTIHSIPSIKSSLHIYYISLEGHGRRKLQLDLLAEAHNHKAVTVEDLVQAYLSGLYSTTSFNVACMRAHARLRQLLHNGGTVLCQCSLRY